MAQNQEESKQRVLAAQREMERATLSMDLKKLESIFDETFIWTQGDGTRMSAQQLLDTFRTGRVKYAKLESSDLSVSIYGDAAVVRGVSIVQLSNSETQFKTFFTLTYVARDGEWKPTAMHTSQLSQ
jgi:hypothetical protein